MLLQTTFQDKPIVQLITEKDGELHCKLTVMALTYEDVPESLIRLGLSLYRLEYVLIDYLIHKEVDKRFIEDFNQRLIDLVREIKIAILDNSEYEDYPGKRLSTRKYILNFPEKKVYESVRVFSSIETLNSVIMELNLPLTV